MLMEMWNRLKTNTWAPRKWSKAYKNKSKVKFMLWDQVFQLYKAHTHRDKFNFIDHKVCVQVAVENLLDFSIFGIVVFIASSAQILNFGLNIVSDYFISY